MNAIKEKEETVKIDEVIEMISYVEMLTEFFQLPEVSLQQFKEYKIPLIDVVKFIKDNSIALNSEIDKGEMVSKLQKLRVIKSEVDVMKMCDDLRELGIINYLKDVKSHLEKMIQHPYKFWLAEQQELIQTINTTEKEQTYFAIKQLYTSFTKLMGSKLTVKLIQAYGDTFKFVPMYFFNDQYVELQNPIHGGQWVISGNPKNHIDDLAALTRGTMIKVHYHIVNEKKSQFYESLISLDYNGFEVLEENLDVLLNEEFTALELKKIYDELNAQYSKSDVLVKQLIKILVPSSKTVKQELEESRNEIKQLKNELENLKNEQQDFLTKKEQIKNALSVEEKRWVQVLESIEYIPEQVDHRKNELLFSEETLIKDLQAKIYHKCGLIYDEHMLSVVMNALRANVLTILAGPSGTGKSSLIQALGKIITNAKVTLVPVQSSWTDAQDLLGYFHPNEKVFVATPFMEALAAARIAYLSEEQNDEIHIICLDEMNLAHIEYYFAQFLSLREQENQYLNLYPKRYYQWAADVKSGEIEVDYYTKKNAEELLEKYPAIFEVPPNVRFVGTLNMDHTVKSLSPKVIDRSTIIELLKLDEDVEKEMENELKMYQNANLLYMPLQQFERATAVYDEQRYEEILKVSALFEHFRDIPLNGRGKKHLKDMLAFWGEEVPNEVVDLLIKGKVLPRIEVKKAEIENLNVMNKLDAYPTTKKKLDAMLNTNHTVSFW